MKKVLDYLLNIRTRAQAGYLVLIDPDRRSVAESVEFAQLAESAGVDALLIGSSLLISDRMDDTIQGIKQHTSLPTILFPISSSRRRIKEQVTLNEPWSGFSTL